MSTMKLSQMVANALDTASQNVASARDAEKTAGLATRVGDKLLDKAVSSGAAASRFGGALIDDASQLGQKYLGGKGHSSGVGRSAMVAGGVLGAAGAHDAKYLHDKYKKASVLETAQDAVKFAESLESLAHLMPKIAGGSIQVNDANGPAISQTAGQGATKDSPTKATSLSPNEAGAQTSSGSGAPLDTNKSAADFAHAAASMMLDAKLAQAKALEMAGHHKTAAQMNLQAKAEFEKAKLAYTEAAPTPKGETKTVPTDFTIPGGVARDNAGMISMTKRDAKTQDVRASASKHISEPALSSASDKGLTDNLNNTSGAKIAGIFSKVAGRKVAEDPKWHEKHRTAMGAAAGGVLGAGAGGLLGHAIGKSTSLGGLAGLGGGLGAYTGMMTGAGLGGLAGHKSLSPDVHAKLIQSHLGQLESLKGRDLRDAAETLRPDLERALSQAHAGKTPDAIY